MRIQYWELFLSYGGLPERGRADLAWSLPPANCLHVLIPGVATFTTVLPFTGTALGRVPTTLEELPSLREPGQAPDPLPRVRRSFRHGLIEGRYRLTRTPRGGVSGRRRTFIGQCCQPFYPGDSTSHPDGPLVVTKSRPARERIKVPRASASLGAWPTTRAET